VLPNGATCTNNTVANGTEVYTYLVPQGTTISSLTVAQEVISTGYGFIDADGLVDNFNVASNDLVPTLPNDLEWGPGFSAQSLVPTLLGGSGVWEAGVACVTGAGVLTDNWNVQITFAASSGDPNGFVWSAVPGPPTSTTTTSTTEAPSTTTTSSTEAPSTTTTSTTEAPSTTTTSTTEAPSTTTTEDPTTTTSTTSASSSTTSTTTADSTTTSTAPAVVSSAGSGGSTGTTGTGGLESSGSASTNGSTTTGALAFTGMPASALRILGAGLLAVGIGLVLLGPLTRRRVVSYVRRSPRSRP